jgi:hypothetical protein
VVGGTAEGTGKGEAIIAGTEVEEEPQGRFALFVLDGLVALEEGGRLTVQAGSWLLWLFGNRPLTYERAACLSLLPDRVSGGSRHGEVLRVRLLARLRLPERKEGRWW